MKYSEIAQKRILGVPVIYLVAGAVIIFAIVAWKMKPSPEVGETPSDEASDPSAEGGLNDPTTADYSKLVPSGTVVVAPQAAPPADKTVETNETWMQTAVKYLIGEGNTAQASQSAISLYLQGADRSYDQQQLVEKAVKKLGPPPEPLESVGTVGAPIAQKQFTNFPGTHTVRGLNDNSASKLAGLYYGSAKVAVGTARIVMFNHGLGPATTNYNVGTKVTIPVWNEPIYHTASASTRTAAQIVKKYPGRTVQQVADLNPGLVFPVAVGTKVRVW